MIICQHEFGMNYTLIASKVTLAINNNEDVEIFFDESYSMKTFFSMLDDLCNHYKYDKNRIKIYTEHVNAKHPDYQLHHSNKNVNFSFFKKECQYISYTKDYDYGLFLSRPNSVRMEAYKQHIDSGLRGLSSFNYNKLGIHLPVLIPDFIEDYPYTWNDYCKNLPYSDIDNLTDCYMIPQQHSSVGWQHIYKKIPLEIVCETYLDNNGYTITEKTLRPMYHWRPSLFIGPINYCKNLQKLGFDTFDDIFNHDYDNLEYQIRVIKVFSELKKFCSTYNYSEFLTSIYDRLENNYKTVLGLSKNYE